MKKTIKRISKKTLTASIKILGKIYTSKGKTVAEALANLQPVGVTKGSSILSISNGERSRDRVLNTIQTYRLFSPSKLTREIALKNISLLFDL